MLPRLGLAALVVAPATAVLGASVLQHGALPYGQNCVTVNPSTSVVQNGWCNGTSNQLFEQVNRNVLRVATGQCLQFASDGSVKAAACDAANLAQNWRFNFDGSIATAGGEYGKCLAAGTGATDAVTIQPCAWRSSSGATPPAQTFRMASFTPERGDVLDAPGVATCIDLATSTSVTATACLGKSSQLWEYTFEEELRQGDVCLSLSGTAVSPAKCSGSDVQKWTLSTLPGHFQHKLSTAQCLDLRRSPIATSGCLASVTQQNFPTARLLATRSRGLKRSIVATPVVDANSCVTANRATLDVLTTACDATALDFWWEYNAAAKTLQLPGNKCLSLAQAPRVALADCSGQQNQQWDYNAATGVFTTPAASGQCLTYADAAPRVLTVQACNVTPKKASQFFAMQEFTKLPPPAMATQQAAFCSAAASAKRRDVAFLRDTLAFGAADFKYLVPSVLDADEAMAYYHGVVLAAIAHVLRVVPANAAAASLLQYKAFKEADVVALLRSVPSGVDALLDLGSLLCGDWSGASSMRVALNTKFVLPKAPASTVVPNFGTVVDYLSIAGVSFLQTALPRDAAVVKVAVSSVGDSIVATIKSLLAARKFRELEAFLATPELVSLTAALSTACDGASAFSICGVLQYRSLRQLQLSLHASIAAANTTGLQTNEYVTPAVLNDAAALVALIRKGAASAAVDAAAWTQYAQYIVFGDASLPYTPRELESSWDSLRVVVSLVTWPAFTNAELTSSSSSWAPLFSALDTILSTARREAIETIVYESPVNYLEAYMTGVTSDMATLSREVLPRICAVVPAAAVCDLLAFQRLTEARSTLARAVRRDGATTGWSDDMDAGAAAFAAVFASKADDELWTVTGARLVFNDVRLQQITDTLTLRTTARPAASLLAYAVFSQYSDALSSLLPYFTFLVDQVAVSHFNGVTALTEARDVAGMVAYAAPVNNATLSDLGVLGAVVLPRVCNNPNNPVFSVCKLQEFYVGLQQIIAFEKRRNARTLILTDVADVDVRKQLEVVDGEKAQYDIITTIQDAANQIGQVIVDESNKLQASVAAASASLQQSLTQKTDALSAQIGEEGRAAQRAIADSTRVLVDTIGAATDAIRDDIDRTSKQLSEQMSEQARETQRQLQAATQLLSTQIGEEAEKTRGRIQDLKTTLSSQLDSVGKSLSAKIDASTERLYKKIGDEATSIRSDIRTSTDKLYKKIGDEASSIRTDIRTATVSLTATMNKNTKLLAGKIDESTAAIKKDVGAKFKQLGSYYASTATVELSTLLAQFKQSDEAAVELFRKLDPALHNMVGAIAALGPLASVAAVGATAYYVAEGLLHGAKAVQDGAKSAWIGSWLSGSADPIGAAQSAQSALASAQSALNAGQFAYLVVEKLIAFQNSLGTYGEIMSKIAQSGIAMQTMAKGIRKLATGSLSNAEAQKEIDVLLVAYNEFSNPLDASTIDGLAHVMDDLITSLGDAVVNAPVGAAPGAIIVLDRAKNSIPPVFAMFSQLCDELDAQFALVGAAATASAKYTGASAIGSRRLRLGGRHLAGETTFTPFFAMADVKLSKLFLEYRIQVVAQQFCSFYEFTMGGAKPPMCTSTAYYSRTDIQRMKSFVYTPPTPSAMVAYLPTKPTPAGDGANGIRPYLDLDKLLAGEAVTFSLPVDDVAWLKKYSWLLRTDTATSVSGLYIDSMQIILPFTKVNSSSKDEPFDMVVDVNILPTQRLNSQVLTAYVVPSTSLRFTSAIDADPLCPSSITNPYHQVAKCVADDYTSKLCVREKSDVARKSLLPSLFSTWQISSPAGLINQPGKGYKLALPSRNATDAVDLNVIALLNVRRIAGGAKPSNINPLAGPGCCADDEYLKGGVCTKCPTGTTGALNGYACQRV